MEFYGWVFVDLSIESCTDYRKQDRRKACIFVEHNRRTGVDRRKQSVFSELIKVTNKIDSKTAKTALAVLEAIPTIRRVNSLPYELDNKNYSRAMGVAMLAAANSPGDIREMGLALREIKNFFKGNPFTYKGQHQASFFKNTFFDSLVDKIPTLEKLDKSLYDTKIGEKVKATLKIKIAPLEKGGINTIEGLSKNAKKISTFKFAGNFGQKLIGRALLRIPVLGLAASFAFEIPSLIKSVENKGTTVDKVKSFTKQLGKSTGHIALVNGAIAIGGALLMPYGVLAALGGMAIGSAVGLFASKKFSDKIEKA